MTTIPLTVIRERERDPQTGRDAQARADRMTTVLKPHEKRMNALADQAIRAKNAAAKVLALREMMALVEKAATGNVACKRGCDACCHIAVTISEQEAVVIGKEIGVKPTLPTRYIDHGNNRANIDQYSGVPCPFLQNGQCTIYASRPLACRTQFNMDADALLCTLVPGEDISVPYWNHMPLTMVFAKAFMGSWEKHADLRAFFPNGKGRLATKELTHDNTNLDRRAVPCRTVNSTDSTPSPSAYLMGMKTE